MSVTSVSATTAVQPEGFRIGNVLSRTTGVLSRHVVLFVLVAGAAQLPSLVLALLAPGVHPRTPGAAFTTTAGVGWLVILVLMPITQTVVYHAAFQDMLGRPIRFSDSLLLALRRFFPVLGALICMGVVIMLGSAALLVPGIIAAAMLAVTIPACVVERLGPFASMGRSAHLTKGNRWRILAIWLLVVAAGAVLGGLAGGLGAVAGLAGSWGLRLLIFVVQSVVGAFSSIAFAVTYHDLRVAKEGLDTDRIAAVFD